LAVLITGGTGFLGAELARLLVEVDAEHPVLMDLFPDRDAVADLAGSVSVVAGDFAEPAEVMAVFRDHDIEGVFHLGYFTAAAELYPSQASRVNALGTTRVFELARAMGVRRVVWPSSAAVHGAVETTPEPEWRTERDIPAPTSVYGACKLFNEHVAEVMAARHGFDHVGFRLCSVFGPGRAGRRGISPDFYAKILDDTRRGEPVVAPPADHILTWGYVKDIARAFRTAYMAENPPHRIYNITGQATTVEEAVTFARQIVPGADIRYGESALRHLAYLDGSLIKNDLGFEPAYTMQEAMTDYLATSAHS
jgi:UDP-glucose 4-epimerase